jgi:RHS repeat-associated protein
MLSDGYRNFAYDDENELIGVWVANAWSNNFAYDGKMRRRIERDYSWNAGTSQWAETNEVHFIYDGNVVVEERNANNVPLASYTRGNDVSGTLQGAGGIGGLLARTTYGQEVPGAPTTAFYHSEGNGNITALIYPNQQLAAKYLYDPFGNMLAMSGPLGNFNKYRFSSKEWDDNSGLYYYGFRFYDPALQRWVNRDPAGGRGFVLLAKTSTIFSKEANPYDFVDNNPETNIDPRGLFSLWNWLFGPSDKEGTKEVVKAALDMADAAISGAAPVASELDPVVRTLCDPCFVLNAAAGELQEKETACEVDNANFNNGQSGDPCARYTKAKQLVNDKAKKLNCN